MNYPLIHKTVNILTILIYSVSLPLAVLAEELDSTNFKIVGATTQGGGIVESTSGNYSTLLSAGSISSDPRIYSTSYKIGTSPETPFLPAVPTISCFETTTDGYSACSTGPTELSTGGMVALCGPGGCYDRARFELGDSPYHYDTSLSGLIRYWPMDEESDDTCSGGEDVCDAMGVLNATSNGTTIVDGRFGKAREYNGTSNSISVSNSGLGLATALTVATWIKADDNTSRNIFNSTPLILHYRGAGFYLRDSSGGNSGYLGWSPHIPSGQWVHVAATWSNPTVGDGQMRLYINGVKQSTELYYAGGTNQTLHSSNTLTIGGYFNSSQIWFDGNIDETMIFDRALSGTEIEDLYDSTQPPTSNPSDTLYAIMISTDNFVSDIRYIDASTFMPETSTTHNINDFMTKTDWESETFNIQGLEAGKTYYLKAFALKGDFTQTEAGPIKSATTATGTVFFDIDIANSTGYTTETSSPYSISFTGAYELIGGSAAITAGDRIWMDVQTNSQGGFAIIGNGTNGGLYSSTTTETITSATADLDDVSSGFGLQNEYIDYDTSSPLYGSISTESIYAGSINSVGSISTTPQKIYDGNGPIVDGRMALKVIAKPGTSYTPASDYQESITLIFVPRY